MDNLLGKLASAIATAEGYFIKDSLPSRNNNPGDLRAAPWLTSPKIVNHFWVADSIASGVAGLYHQLALDIARGQSLRQLITSWAPPSENNTSNYLSETARRVGISNVDQPLQELLEIERIP